MSHIIYPFNSYLPKRNESLWMASPARWTWVWASFQSCWWTGKPGMLQSMVLQRVGHDWETELNGCQFVHMLMNVHVNFICNSPKLETAQNYTKGECINKVWDVLTMKHNSEIKRNELSTKYLTSTLLFFLRGQIMYCLVVISILKNYKNHFF